MLKPPCSILTGFLGSGKTTLLQHVLETGLSQGPVAIVMNELGDIGIDGNVVTDFQSVEKMVELNSGCVCCTISDMELGQALNEIIDEISPRLIIIETTGVAEPGPIEARLRTFGFHIESIVSVVDALTFPGTETTEEIIKNQIRPADFIVLNKVDEVGEDKRKEIEQAIEDLNPRALVLPTNYGITDPQLLFTAGVNKRTRPATNADTDTSTDHEQKHSHDHDHDHDHDHQRPGHVDTFSFSSEHHLDMNGLETLLEQLPKQIIRAKGLLTRGENAAPTLFNYVCGRFDFRDMPEFKSLTTTQAVFIGEFSEDLKTSILEKLHRLEKVG